MIDQVRPALLVDVRNALYRAVYAHRAEETRGGHPVHPFVIFMRLLNLWIRNYSPSSIHMFWDAPRSDVWRRKILTTYKDREKNPYVTDISDDLKKLTAVCEEMFKFMGVRQYQRKFMEADDLIYSAVSVLHPTKTVVISTDSDMIQIPYRYSSNILFEPRKEKEITVPVSNPVLVKALQGDKSDNIPGYRGIGPKKAVKLADDYKLLAEFLALNDKSIYNRNLLLIDLSMCPKILNNTIYVRRKLAEQVTFDRQTILSLAQDCKINGFLNEFNDLVFPLKNLV